MFPRALFRALDLVFVLFGFRLRVENSSRGRHEKGEFQLIVAK
jgi:hypothetical protein